MIELLLLIIIFILFPPLLGLLTFGGGLGLVIAGLAGLAWIGFSLYDGFGWTAIQIAAVVMVGFFFLCKHYQRIEIEKARTGATGDEKTDIELRLKELEILIKRSEAAARVNEHRSSLRWQATLNYNKRLTHLGLSLRRLLNRELIAEFHSKQLEARLQEQQELTTRLADLDEVVA